MPISLSAKKSLRKALKNRKENVSLKNKLKATVKKFLLKPNEDGLKEVYSVLDKVSKNGVFHHNKVARLKSKYAKIANGKEIEKPVKKATKPNKKALKAKKAAKKMS